MSDPHSVVTHQSGPLRLTGRRRPIWENQREEVGEQGKLIYFAPNLGCIQRFAAGHTVGVPGQDDVLHIGNHGLAHMNMTSGGAGTETVGSVGGRLVCVTDAADNDLVCIGTWGPAATATGSALPFDAVASSTIRFGIKLKVDDADTVDLFAGLAVVDTDPLTAVADGIYFEKLGATLTWSAVLEAGSAETQLDTLAGGSLADDTYMELGFVVNGRSSVDFYVDGTRTTQTTITNLTAVPLCPVIMIRNFSATNSTLTVEKWACCQTMV